MPEIIDGQVVQTVRTDLAEFIAQRKAELDMLKQTIEGLTEKQNTIITELETLIPTENV